MKLTVKGDEIVADFTGTSPQMGGALHTNYWFTASLTYAALRTMLPPETPNNVGFYRPINVIAPEGCWVNPRYPAAVGARGQGGCAGPDLQLRTAPGCRITAMLSMTPRTPFTSGTAILPCTRRPQGSSVAT